MLFICVTVQVRKLRTANCELRIDDDDDDDKETTLHLANLSKSISNLAPIHTPSVRPLDRNNDTLALLDIRITV